MRTPRYRAIVRAHNMKVIRPSHNAIGMKINQDYFNILAVDKSKRLVFRDYIMSLQVATATEACKKGMTFVAQIEAMDKEGAFDHDCEDSTLHS